MDLIPMYLNKRDIENMHVKSEEMIQLKKSLLIHPRISKILDQQLEDGSWGRFHSMDTTNMKNFPTEKALRILLHLGLDQHDLPIIKAVSYMEGFLKGDHPLRDPVEKKHDWKVLTELFVSTWLLRIDSENLLAKTHAKKWTRIITTSFRSGHFNKEDYETAYYDVLSPREKTVIWNLENFYVVSICTRLLDEATKKAYLDHLIHNKTGIYYICGQRLNVLPSKLDHKDMLRFLLALDMLADFRVKHPILIAHKRALVTLAVDGKWCFDHVKDLLHLPLSESWRKKTNKKIDCTLFVQRIVNKIID